MAQDAGVQMMLSRPREVLMPEGKYLVQALPDGSWAVLPPRSKRWHEGFDNRLQASIAIAEQKIPVPAA